MSTAKLPRKPTPPEIELLVLERSRRRCALCFSLRGDLTEKHGQIAHLDQNRTNFREDNLSFLCMEHHSLYDSSTKQHKNYTIAEAKSARNRLYDAIAQGKHISTGTSLDVSTASMLSQAKISSLQKLHEVLVKGHYEINRRAKAAVPQTKEEYRSQVEVHEFAFLDALTMAEIYLDQDTSAAMHVVLGSLRQMCTSIWLRVPEIFEANGKHADPEIREPDWRLFTTSFDAARAILKTLLNPTTTIDIGNRAPPPFPDRTAAASPSLANMEGIWKQIKRLKVEWDLNRHVRPGMFQQAKHILGKLYPMVADLYAELSDHQELTATTLLRSALGQVVGLENIQICHDTDVQGYWCAGDDVFDLLERAQASLQAV